MYKYRMGRFRDMRMSHMIADSRDELLDMADRLGVQHRWIQYPGTPKEHFDIPVRVRLEAIQLGAVEVSMKELVRIIRRKSALEDSEPIAAE